MAGLDRIERLLEIPDIASQDARLTRSADPGAAREIRPQTLRFGQIILIGSALSFLGMGAQPPTAELGMMAAQGRDFLFMAPHIATVPSLAIFVIVLCANLLGDAIRDVLDPRLQQ